MVPAHYNLIDEKWLPVVDRSLQSRRVSLKEALLCSDEYLAIDGETPLQTVALLRLLIALSITILTRYDVAGNEAKFTNPHEAKKRWKEVFLAGRMPEKAVEKYLTKWYDRFYLLGGTNPFLQVRPEEVRFVEKAGNGPDNNVMTLRRAYLEPEIIPDYDDVCSCAWNSAGQLNGTILESGNKLSAVAERQGFWKEHLTYEEAAAWLVYLLAFVHCGNCGKGHFNDKKAPDGESLRSAKMTAASGGCLVYADGETLFKTIMMNAPLAKFIPGGWEMYGTPLPAWEDDREYLMKDRRTVPDNLPGVLVQLSRRVLLHESEDGLIDGFHIGMGDYWSDNGMEPMFMRKVDKKTSELKPIHYSENTLEWQNCECLFGGTDETRPIAAEWTMAMLEDLEIYDPVMFRMTDITYGTMNSVVNCTISGGLHISPEFFKDNGVLAEQARLELEHIEAYATIMQNLGKNLGKAEGMNEGLAADYAAKVKTVYYDRIGRWFLRFLAQDGIKTETLQKEEYTVALGICEEEAAKVTMESVTGHGNDQMTMGRAYGICRRELVKLGSKLKGDE